MEEERKRRELNICYKFKCRSSTLAPTIILHEGHCSPYMEKKP